MFSGKNLRAAKSIRRRRDSEEESITFDPTDGLEKILRDVVSVVCIRNGITKGRKLGYLNAAVRTVIVIYSDQKSPQNQAVNECEDGPTVDLQLYFCLLRCPLLHEGKEIRAAALRLIRHLLRKVADVETLIRVNAMPLIIRCLDIMLDNQMERIQAVRLARKILHLAPLCFPESLARCLVALAQDGGKERDRMLRAALAILSELAVLNPSLFVDCGGISVALHNVLDSVMPRINEALLGAVLFLVNDPEWRWHCAPALLQILAPFSDAAYKHTGDDLDCCTKSEEKDLRLQASKLALLVCLRSWPGLVALCQYEESIVLALIALMKPNHEETRRAIVDVFCDLFRVPTGEWTSDLNKAVHDLRCGFCVDTDAWRLHEGFVAAEAKAVLPHTACVRPNLIQNHLALVLYALIKVDLLPTLCEVIVSSSPMLSVRTTILLGQLLHLANQNLPVECLNSSLSLPSLMESATGGREPSYRVKATSAIEALLIISRYQQTTPMCPHNASLYLAQLVQRLNKKGMSASAEIDPRDLDAKLSQWFSVDSDEVIQETLKETGILTSGSNPSFWNWNLIRHILQWQSESLCRGDGEGGGRLFLQRLVHFFKPSADLFSNLPMTDSICRVVAEVMLVFCDFLLKAGKEESGQLLLEELLVDISKNLSVISGSERIAHDAVFSPSHIHSYASQYFFLLLGRLSESPEGHDLLCKADIYQQLGDILRVTKSDIYAKLISTCLDYSINGPNRDLLVQILTKCQLPCRMYATNLLRVPIRVGGNGSVAWVVKLLVGQLSDASGSVVSAALDVLDEACDDREYLNKLLVFLPTVTTMGYHGLPLLTRLLATSAGFQMYCETNSISDLLDDWATVHCYSYVKLVQTAVSDSLSQHQRGDDGTYGRRSGGRHYVHDVFVPPHLFGALASHSEGLAVLTSHEALLRYVQMVRVGDVSTEENVTKLKAAIWALGHTGSSFDGITWLAGQGSIASLVSMAKSNSFYSVRGCCFQAICLIGVSGEGVRILRNHGWVCVRRNHKEHFQIGDPYMTDKDQVYEMSEVNRMVMSLDDSEDFIEGVSLVSDVSLMEEASTQTNKRSQTMPYGTFPPWKGDGGRHHRSLSDYAVPPMATPKEDVSVTPSSKFGLVRQGSLNLRRKLMASFRKRSQGRRDSTGSHSSAGSTASERVASFLGRFSGHSVRPRTYTDPTDRESETFQVELSHAGRDSVSGGSLRDSDDHENADFSLTESTRVTSPTDVSYHQSDMTPQHAITPVAMAATPTSSVRYESVASRSFSVLRSLNRRRRRAISDSQAEIGRRGRWSGAAYEDNIMNSSNYSSSLNSPSGGRGDSCLLSQQGGHSRRLHYLGMALPMDLSSLFAESAHIHDHKVRHTSNTSVCVDRFPSIIESELETDEDVTQIETEVMVECDPIVWNPLRMGVKLNPQHWGLELHTIYNCVGCFSLGLNMSSGGGERSQMLPDYATILESPPHRRVLATASEGQSTISETSESSSVTSQGWEDQGDAKLSLLERANAPLICREILRLVTLLLSSVAAKSAESRLLTLKQKFPKSFQDACLYTEICLMFASFSFRLSFRRFIQELFMDSPFNEIFDEANRLLAVLRSEENDDTVAVVTSTTVTSLHIDEDINDEVTSTDVFDEPTVDC